MSTQREVGIALDRLDQDVLEHVLDLTAQYTRLGLVGVLKQAVDTPHRATVQVADWIARYNAKHGAGTAQTFLAACLVAAGSQRTLAQINASVAALAAQAQVLVAHVANDGWTWPQVAAAIQSAFQVNETYSYRDLPIPGGYVDVWGEGW